MFVEQQRAPACTVQLDRHKPACGQLMFRVGKPENFGWVCPECDRVPVSQALDTPE